GHVREDLAGTPLQPLSFHTGQLRGACLQAAPSYLVGRRPCDSHAPNFRIRECSKDRNMPPPPGTNCSSLGGFGRKGSGVKHLAGLRPGVYQTKKGKPSWIKRVARGFIISRKTDTEFVARRCLLQIQSHRLRKMEGGLLWPPPLPCGLVPS